MIQDRFENYKDDQYWRKYAFIMGATKYETKQLKKIFESRNKTYPYPKERGL
jgi:hypothetical protein